MNGPRVPLYERLPELYRQRDAEQRPEYPLRALVGLVEGAFDALHENIESLYHDLFIETCDEWVVPYIGDLLGVSHLKGDPWTLRADVADTIELRRRKGTRGAIELLAFDLSGWGVHAIELSKSLAWFQHLNHQRPDAGGKPPYASFSLRTLPRGGTVAVRSPAALSLLGTPFDPFAHVPDLKRPDEGAIAYNLPNLAIFLWRLLPMRIRLGRPAAKVPVPLSPDPDYPNKAAQAVRFDVDPLARPVQLFSLSDFDPDARPLVVSTLDHVPGPIPSARLTSGDPMAAPAAYVDVSLYDPNDPDSAQIDPKRSLRLHIPEPGFSPLSPDPTVGWTFRGANLCQWEDGLNPPLALFEVAIDPRRGRIVIGVDSASRAQALFQDLRLSYAYGATGPVGAHPTAFDRAVEIGGEPLPAAIVVGRPPHSPTLEEALATLDSEGPPLVIELADSEIHRFDLSLVAGSVNEAAGWSLCLGRSLVVRAAPGERPIVQLSMPLRLRPTEVSGVDQPAIDARNAKLSVRFEGVFLTAGAGFTGEPALITRAAVHSLEFVNSTLDPGGFRNLDGTRAPATTGLALEQGYGFDVADAAAFKETPRILVLRSVVGALFLDHLGYTLEIRDSIVDGADEPFALSGPGSDPSTVFGPVTEIEGATFFGRVRSEQMAGRGGIFAGRLEVRNDQMGCIKWSYFSGDADRLPQNYACVTGLDAALAFTSDCHGDPAYAQLARRADFQIRERGPGDEAMGAFGFLFEAHKWKNLAIRFREFMPVGVRPLLIPVT